MEFRTRTQGRDQGLKKYLASLNPAERRIVVFVAVLFFVVINLFFIWPHYGDLALWGNRRAAAEQKLINYEKTTAQAREVEPKLRKLEGSGANVPAEDQSVQLLQTITRQAAQNGVAITASGRQITRTNNQFFVEQEQSITTQSGEEQLVHFLHGLGLEDSLIRVRSLTVRPDPRRQELIAQVTLIASYQKNAKPATRTPAATPAASRPGTTPAASEKKAPLKPSVPSREHPAPPIRPKKS